MSEELTKTPRTKAFAAARHEQTTAEAMAVITRDLEAAREKTRRLRAMREAAERKAPQKSSARRSRSA